MVSKMEKIETHFIDDGPYCRLKVDVKTIRKNIVGIKILSYNRKMEFEFDKSKVTDLKSELIDFDDKQNIMKEDFKIPEDKLYDFLYYASNDKLFSQIVKTNSNIVIYDFMKAKSKS